MSSSSEDTPAQRTRGGVAAATAPTEIIDEVLGHLVIWGGQPEEIESLKDVSLVCRAWQRPAQRRLQMCVARTRTLNAVMGHLVEFGRPDRDSLLAASLTCRHWRHPAQKYLLQSVAIRSGTQAERALVRLADGAGEHVKSLEIQFIDIDELLRDPVNESPGQVIEAADGITRDRLLALLPLFPNTTELHLKGPTFTQFFLSDLHILSNLPSLRHLTSLHIWTVPWLRTADVVHDLLLRTPELKSLDLRCFVTSKERISPHSGVPIHLPLLDSLHLSGPWASSFVDLGVLSSTTLSQVRTLVWNPDEETPTPSIIPLMELMGANLTSLDHVTDNWILELARDLQSCTALKELTLGWAQPLHFDEIIPLDLPPTTHTLVIEHMEDAHNLLAGVAAPQGCLRTVELGCGLEFEEDYEDNFHEIESIVRSCRRGEIEMVSEGKVLRRILAEIDWDSTAAEEDFFRLLGEFEYPVCTLDSRFFP